MDGASRGRRERPCQLTWTRLRTKSSRRPAHLGMVCHAEASSERGMRCAMPPTTPERYAVASCHVERPLDDRVWSAFAALQERRPGGLSIAALIRPPDAVAGEHDDERWLARAREAAERGPLGHHVHFTSPTHARPTGDPTGERVQREGLWLREHGLRPTLFCGGGWYTDHTVALACAELGYADCTPEDPAAVPPGRRGLGGALSAGADRPGRHGPGRGPDDARRRRSRPRARPPRPPATRPRLLPRHGPDRAAQARADRLGARVARPAQARDGPRQDRPLRARPRPDRDLGCRRAGEAAAARA